YELGLVSIMSGKIAEGMRIVKETLTSANAQQIANALPEVLGALGIANYSLDASDFVRFAASLPNADRRAFIEAAWVLAINPDPLGRSYEESRKFLSRLDVANLQDEDKLKVELTSAALLAAEGKFLQARELAERVARTAFGMKKTGIAERATKMAAAYAASKFWTP
ncbi:MAG: hypothetical protein NZL93_05005, partial [Chthoniobacterales bacterium]|nr:hypothetical protein [Chthoniobacterales bacterium]